MASLWALLAEWRRQDNHHQVIMNLFHRNFGEIKVFGLDSVRHEKEIKERIGFVMTMIFYF